MLLLTAGCTRLDPPAPLDDRRGQALPPGGIVVVEPGDTVYGLSRRYQVPARDIIETNGLAPPYHLRIGQKLVLPAPREHVVKEGDTLYSISRMYQVDLRELVTLNGIAEPYTIRIGQTLRLPWGGEIRDAPRDAAPQMAQTTLIAPPPRKPGQQAASVAIAQPQAGATTPPRRAGGARPAVETEALPPPAPAAPARRETAAASAPPVVTPPPPPRPAAASPPAPPVRSGPVFLWPVKGTVVSDFGPKPGGLHNDGINIAAPQGTPVRAAEAGVVAYAGNELRGFGNLLLIRHAEGWMTAYAHLDEMRVDRGATVARGQTIGTVGSTGAVTTPQLHFEVRQGSRAVDPRRHLEGARDASRETGRDGPPGPG